ncbi:cupin domain-containing protein [Burkholderia sp. Bp8998]|uniref:cupin domain-containing protein n=1 Tax=Burkholderia sp. Bp8998 TaxID=2184557 RepID=UPI000F59E630|nr:cupin domain-containing protein [Burkholderia sp. Bp8998]RQS14844.1 cupin domain-containing protein [Burkholderia sp. Bp8998]
MNVTRFRDAPEYFPPNHFGMQCVRLQGREAGPAESLWLGVSTIEPGGHTTMEGAGVEKHYVVLEGRVCVDADGVEVDLQAFDSCRLAPGERRALRNRSDRPARILLAMPFSRPPHD